MNNEYSEIVEPLRQEPEAPLITRPTATSSANPALNLNTGFDPRQESGDFMSHVLSYLKTNLSKARYKHSIGVWQTAVELAKQHKCYSPKVDLAALLHDAGKGVSKDRLVSYVIKHKIKMPYFKETLKYNPWLLHGFVSAAIAQKVFKIKDKSILKAIASHTIGAPKMSKLAKIIYLADITAPDRRFPFVKKIRWHAKRDLDTAMMAAMENKMHQVLLNKKWIHPVAIMAWNSIACSSIACSSLASGGNK